MTLDNPEEKSFLYQLYTMTRGDTEAQVSMYDVGAELSIGNNDAGKLAEALYSEGFAELKTLSGGIGITQVGLKVLNKEDKSVESNLLQLNQGPVLDQRGHEASVTILKEIKAASSNLKLTYEQTDELVIDIKSMEIQMLSPHPKTGIIREILASILKNLESIIPESLKLNLKSMITRDEHA